MEQKSPQKSPQKTLQKPIPQFQIENDPRIEKFNAKLDKIFATAVRRFRVVEQKMAVLEAPDKKTWYIVTNSLFYRLLEYELRRDHFVFKKLYNAYGHMHKASSPNLGTTPRKFCVKLSKILKQSLENQLQAYEQESDIKDFDHLLPVSAVNDSPIDNPDNLDKILTDENEGVVLEENNNLDSIVNKLLDNGEISPEQLNQL